MQSSSRVSTSRALQAYSELVRSAGFPAIVPASGRELDKLLQKVPASSQARRDLEAYVQASGFLTFTSAVASSGSLYSIAAVGSTQRSSAGVGAGVHPSQFQAAPGSGGEAMSTTDFVGEARKQLAFLEKSSSDVAVLLADNKRERAAVSARATEAAGELAAALLPSVDPAVVQRAITLSGYPNLRSQVAGVPATSEANIAAVHGLSDAQRSQLGELVKVGFGTSNYSRSWFSWGAKGSDKASAQALENATGKSMNELRAGFLAWAPLTKAQAMLASHLLGADHAELGKRLGGKAELDVFKRMSGLAAQHAVLEKLAQDKLTPLAQSLQRDAAALSRDIQAAGRARTRLDRSAIGQRFDTQRRHYATQVGSTSQVQTSVARFRGYDTVSPTYVSTSSGVSPFEMWFWYNVFVSHDHGAYVGGQVYSGGGGDFGGAGAGASWQTEAKNLAADADRLFGPLDVGTTAAQLGVDSAVVSSSSVFGDDASRDVAPQGSTTYETHYTPVDSGVDVSGRDSNTSFSDSSDARSSSY